MLGPGSLYTSLLPSLLHPGRPRRGRWRPGDRACTCATSRRRKERRPGFDLAGHVAALIAHTAPGIVDLVLANNRFDARTPTDWHGGDGPARWPPDGLDRPPRLVLDDVVDPDNAHHHDPARLAAARHARLRGARPRARRRTDGHADRLRHDDIGT